MTRLGVDPLAIMCWGESLDQLFDQPRLVERMNFDQECRSFTVLELIRVEEHIFIAFDIADHDR